MTYEQMKSEMTVALKQGDKFRRLVIADAVAAIDKAATAGKTRVELTEDFVNDCLIKYQKTIQEMIDTCPSSRPDLLEDYNKRMEIIKNYAPQLLTDEVEIRTLIERYCEGIEFVRGNRGMIMKTIAPAFKGKVDMKIVNKVLGEMLK